MCTVTPDIWPIFWSVAIACTLILAMNWKRGRDRGRDYLGDARARAMGALRQGRRQRTWLRYRR
jgi:hypothetical protein